MVRHLPLDTAVVGWLHTLGVVSRCQWDVLVFLADHQTTLLGAESLARLLGYATEPLLDALDVLEALDLVECSRVSQGARLYTFTSPRGAPLREPLAQLQALAGHRAGRILIAQQLRRDDHTPAETRRAARRQARAARSQPWLQAI